MARFIYFIVPVAALLVFGGYYFGVFYKDHVAAIEAADAKKKADDEQARIEKQKAEKEAAEQAQIRMDQKRAEDKAKEDKRLADRKKTLDDLDEEIARQSKRVDDLTREHADLEVKLLELRRVREAEQKKAFDSARTVELARIDRRNAELEIQLNTEKLATRVEGSSLVEMPIFPTPPATGKGETARQ